MSEPEWVDPAVTPYYFVPVFWTHTEYGETVLLNWIYKYGIKLGEVTPFIRDLAEATALWLRDEYERGYDEGTQDL